MLHAHDLLTLAALLVAVSSRLDALDAALGERTALDDIGAALSGLAGCPPEGPVPLQSGWSYAAKEPQTLAHGSIESKEPTTRAALEADVIRWSRSVRRAEDLLLEAVRTGENESGARLQRNALELSRQSALTRLVNAYPEESAS